MPVTVTDCIKMASAWIFLQYAECFVGGFLASYLLCSRSSKKPVEKEESIVYDDDKTEIVMIEEENVDKIGDLKNDWSNEGIVDGKQEVQAKQSREEVNSEEEKYAEKVKEENNTEQ